MTTITKEQLIEDLKASTQNASGMFEISEDTICALMSALTNAAPQLPQPAVVMDEEQSKILFDEWSGGDAALGELRAIGVPDEFISMLKDFSLATWEACREAMVKQAAQFIVTSDDRMMEMPATHDIDAVGAMLQGAEPVTPAYKSPDDFDFDRFNDVVWLEAVASNPSMHSLTTSTIAMVALELNRKLADCNSPVIPDGWVACSERMPETMVSVLVTGTWFHNSVAFWDGLSWYDLDFEQPVTHWMPLPAAPQQEVK